MVLITYDVCTIDAEGRKRLRKVAKRCEDYGQRVQNSVFECDVDSAMLVRLKSSLLDIIDEKQDSLRIYQLGSKWRNRVEHFGVKVSYDPEGFICL
jgi:CRISPR-associated protein Cas2